ncbi:hypothetical protein GCM10022419_037110 [Nonomuraea rosea]|uniref:Uncharacterized protein n=1 Tax=Nonomuraea rosea TaxID=638574 RepID=A0ABP6WR14_9ACTN
MTVDARSTWFIHADKMGGISGVDVWDLAENRAFPAADPGTFINYVNVWSRNAETSTQEAKYIKNNLSIKSTGEACFVNDRTSASAGVQLEIDNQKNGTGGVSGGIQGSVETACKSYEATGPAKPPNPDPGDDFTLSPVWNKRRVKAECFHGFPGTCNIKAYSHRFRAEVTFCYHVAKSKTTCIP